MRENTITYEEEIPKTLNGFLAWQFTSGSITGEDFNKFSSLFRKYIAGSLPAGAKLDKFKKGHYDLFGFIELNDKFIYFSISDVRFFQNEWSTNILIRTAKNNTDYTGGSNCYTSLSNFLNNILKLFLP